MLPPRTKLFLHTVCFRTQQSLTVSLCGIPLHGWAVVAPRYFHITITAQLQLTGATLDGQKFEKLTYCKDAILRQYRWALHFDPLHCKLSYLSFRLSWLLWTCQWCGWGSWAQRFGTESSISHGVWQKSVEIKFTHLSAARNVFPVISMWLLF